MSEEAPFFSIVIPVHNEEENVAAALKSIRVSTFGAFEVIVVDDCSTDGSVEAARAFPVRILRQERNLGPSLARNRGAAAARGKFIVFTDADCLFSPDLLEQTARRLREERLQVLGGTYQKISVDGTFAADFQAIMDHFYETRKPAADYLAAHYLVIERELFARTGGFRCDELIGRAAACEDLELSRRLIQMGFLLRVFPDLAVGHYFGFGLRRALANAFRKSRHWVKYLSAAGRLAGDTGVGSRELKTSVALLLVFMASLPVLIWSRWGAALAAASVLMMAGVNLALLSFIKRERGFPFAFKSFVYYCFPYAFFTGLGAAAAGGEIARGLFRRGKR